jgi:hypothetical protein
MSFLCQNREARPLTRREMLRTSSAGFGALALQGLLAEEARAGFALAPKSPPLPAKAKRVIFLFMHGGPSQVDLFDHKPLLTRDDNKPLPFDKPRIVSAKTGNLLASPWKFKQHGESGAEVSEILPHIASIVDDLCIVRSIYGSNSRHGGALLELHTGSDTFTRPSMGSWINYGLGTENQNLPGYLTINPSSSHGGSNAWSSAFLPAHYQGTRIGGKGKGMTVPFIESPIKDRDLQRQELDLLNAINGDHLVRSAGDSELEARIASYELAFRMQMEAPKVQDVSGEPESIKKLYGLDQGNTRKFGEQCLMARRYSEAGVRFVQVTHRYWDQHGGLKKDHARLAGEMDQPVAALITDLKQRGMLEDTLVLWGGEFGRTPVAQGRDGRDHNPHGFTMFLAGGGVKAGLQYGATDEYGYYATENRVHFHDLHATMLHQMGIDHKELTYRYAGRDFRLTDVHGRVVKDLLA